MNTKLNTVKDVDQMIVEIIKTTPTNIAVNKKVVTDQVMTAMNVQFGPDPSNVRAMITMEQIKTKVMAHCRRVYESPEDENNQLAFGEFGEDIQERYPVKTITTGGKSETQYESPLYAPLPALETWMDTQLKVAKTLRRRVKKLRGWIAINR